MAVGPGYSMSLYRKTLLAIIVLSIMLLASVANAVTLTVSYNVPIWAQVDGVSSINRADRGPDAVYAVGGGILMKVDNNWNIIWAKEIPQTVLSDVRVANNAIYVAGVSLGDLVIGKFDFSGNPIWVYKYDWPNNVSRISINVTGTNIVVSGGIDTPNLENVAIFVALFDDTGSFIWAKVLNITRNQHFAKYVAIKDNAVYVTYTGLYATGVEASYVTKLYLNGSLAWNKEITMSGCYFYISDLIFNGTAAVISGSCNGFTVLKTDGEINNVARAVSVTIGPDNIGLRYPIMVYNNLIYGTSGYTNIMMFTSNLDPYDGRSLPGVDPVNSGTRFFGVGVRPDGLIFTYGLYRTSYLSPSYGTFFYNILDWNQFAIADRSTDVTASVAITDKTASTIVLDYSPTGIQDLTGTVIANNGLSATINEATFTVDYTLRANATIMSVTPLIQSYTTPIYSYTSKPYLLDSNTIIMGLKNKPYYTLIDANTGKSEIWEITPLESVYRYNLLRARPARDGSIYLVLQVYINFTTQFFEVIRVSRDGSVLSTSQGVGIWRPLGEASLLEDMSGNTYIITGGGTGTVTGTIIIKLSSNGTLLWAKAVPNTYTGVSYDIVGKCNIDDTIILPLEDDLTGVLYITKIATNGSILKAVELSHTSGVPWLYNIAVDDSCNTYVVGLTPDYQAFLLKLDPQFNVVYARTYTNIEFTNILIDGNNIIVSAYAYATQDYVCAGILDTNGYPGRFLCTQGTWADYIIKASGAYYLASEGGRDIYVIKAYIPYINVNVADATVNFTTTPVSLQVVDVTSDMTIFQPVSMSVNLSTLNLTANIIEIPTTLTTASLLVNTTADDVIITMPSLTCYGNPLALGLEPDMTAPQVGIMNLTVYGTEQWLVHAGYIVYHRDFILYTTVPIASIERPGPGHIRVTLSQPGMVYMLIPNDSGILRVEKNGLLVCQGEDCAYARGGDGLIAFDPVSIDIYYAVQARPPRALGGVATPVIHASLAYAGLVAACLLVLVVLRRTR